MINSVPPDTFTPTEKCIIEVLNESRFSVTDKCRLVVSYYPVISRSAVAYMVDRIVLIERLKQVLKN